MRARIWTGRMVTGLMAALMLLSAVPDVLRIPNAVITFKHLGYPPYLLVFLGTAKILGVLAVLVPGLPRIKEWVVLGSYVVYRRRRTPDLLSESEPQSEQTAAIERRFGLHT